MFDFPGSAGIQSFKDDQQARMLGSFHIDEAPLAQASLIKGMELDEFNDKYPVDAFERYSFESLSRAKDDFMKADGAKVEDFEASTQNMTQVVVSQGARKALMYVRPKAQA